MIDVYHVTALVPLSGHGVQWDPTRWGQARTWVAEAVSQHRLHSFLKQWGKEPCTVHWLWKLILTPGPDGVMWSCLGVEEWKSANWLHIQKADILMWVVAIENHRLGDLSTSLLTVRRLKSVKLWYRKIQFSRSVFTYSFVPVPRDPAFFSSPPGDSAIMASFNTSWYDIED